MAKNPMQKKAQTSFLLGMLLATFIAAIIIAVLVLQLVKLNDEKKAVKATLKRVYVLTEDINSGDSITAEKLTLQEVESSMIPADAVSSTELEGKTNIQDENGNLIKKVEVIAKINLKKGTVLTSDMIAEKGEITADLRKVEYNMIALTSQLENNKYVDVRLRLPNGKDFVVTSHKRIEIPSIDGVDSLNTIWLNLNEAEILTLSCAIVESYKIEGSLLYVTEYVEPGLQEAATLTYLPDNSTINLINQDPNCVAEAKQALFQRFLTEEGNFDTNKTKIVRDPINNSLNENAENAMDNVKDKTQDEVKTLQEQRQLYLESLGGSY